MTLDSVVNFIKNNINFFSTKEIGLFVNWKFNQLIDSLEKKYYSSTDKSAKKNIEQIIIFLKKFIEDYKKSPYKYSIKKISSIEWYRYWLDWYLDKWLIDKAQELFEEFKVKFPNAKRDIIKYEKEIKKFLSSRNEEEERLRQELKYWSTINKIEGLINIWDYNAAIYELLEALKEYPDDKNLNKYLDQIEKLKAKTLLETIELRDIEETLKKLELVWLLEKPVDNVTLSESEKKQIYKALKKLLKEWNYDDWLVVIKFVKEQFKYFDKKLAKLEKEFLKKKLEDLKNKQRKEYQMELDSLKLLIDSKQYEQALIKINSLLKKYPFVEKKELVKLMKKILKLKEKEVKEKIKKNKKHNIEKFLYKFVQPSKKDINEFYKKMSWFLNANVDIKTALSIIYNQAKSLGAKKFYSWLKKWIENGLKLSEVLLLYPNVSRMDISLIKIWEETGTLPQVFSVITERIEDEELRRKQIKSVLTYPIIVIILSIIIFSLLLIFLIPKFIVFFKQVNVPLPFITRVIIELSNFVRVNWLYISIAILIIIILFRFLASTIVWKYVFSYLAIKLPVIKEIVRRKYIIYIFYNLWILLKNWVPILTSLDLIKDGLQNILYKKEIERIRFEVEHWKLLSQAIGLYDIEDSIVNYANDYIPIDIAYNIYIWERTWQVSSILLESWERYKKDLAFIIKNLQNLLEPFIILIVWLLVFALILAIFLPMINIYNVIAKMWKI